MPCDEKIYPTEPQWLHSGWGKKAEKRKLANSVSALSASYRTSDPYGIRTHDAAVKGRSLNHLTNGPKKLREFVVAVTGLEPVTPWV